MGNKATDPDLKDEYDFSKGVRNKYAKRMPKDALYVAIDPDVAAVFSDGKSVNKALRAIIEAMRPTRTKKSA